MTKKEVKKDIVKRLRKTTTWNAVVYAFYMKLAKQEIGCKYES